MTLITSFVFYYISKRLSLCKTSLVVTISVLNVLFCAIFPLLVAVLSGDARGGAPLRNLWVVALAMLLWAIFYLALIILRVMLRSPSLKFSIPIPIPEPNMAVSPIAETPVTVYSDKTAGLTGAKPAEAIAVEAVQTAYEKDTVDTAANLDKMGNTTELKQGTGKNNVSLLISHAFDCLEAGMLEDAAVHFYEAIENRPPLSLEIQIAIQLCMIYNELGQAELSYEILNGYYTEYQNQLSDKDRLILETGIDIVGSVTAGIGGYGDEKN